MRNILQVLVGWIKPRSCKTGVEPTIPVGKIIAKPQADGGYSIFLYHGIVLGWLPAGVVPPDGDLKQAMANLARPVNIYTLNAGTHVPERSGGNVQ